MLDKLKEMMIINKKIRGTIIEGVVFIGFIGIILLLAFVWNGCQLQDDVVDLKPIEITKYTSALKEDIKDTVAPPEPTVALEKDVVVTKVEVVKEVPKEVPKEVVKESPKVTRSEGTRKNFTATAYDLSVASCGKAKGSKGYGITASGYSLVGHSRASAMSIAVDPKVIKLGTQVKIEFPEPYTHFNGTYTARDTGGAIKGNIVDIFMGEDVSNKDVMAFGRREVKLTILK